MIKCPLLGACSVCCRKCKKYKICTSLKRCENHPDKCGNAKLDEIKVLKTDKQALEEKMTELTESSKNAEEFKEKFENLQKEIKEKEEKAEADRVAKEKADGIASRFDAVVGEKKFTHEAIREAYHKKFGEALENKDFEGKSDAEIFHELTKDDGAAFEGVTTIQLPGGGNKGGLGAEVDDAQARAVMGLPPLK